MNAHPLIATVGTAAERYDRALLRAKDYRLPASARTPCSTAGWPVESVELLERYRDWLLSGGLSTAVINQLYLPTAGHVLGFNLKPPDELNLETDLQCVLDYVRAKRSSAMWQKNTRIALEKFHQFLRQQRGEVLVAFRPLGRERYTAGLPAWLLEPLERYYHLHQSHWRPARTKVQSLSFWNSHTQVWRWILERHALSGLADVRRQYLLDYADHALTAGYAASTINNALRCFHAFLLFLQEQDYRVPLSLLRLPSLKEPERLPRFLTDEQVRRLRDDFERRVVSSRFPAERRDALLDRAGFYLLWQGGLRLGEVEELRLEDLDLAGRKLVVRQGKGRKDRAIYLADAAVHALQEYLPVRGQGPDDHVFFYRHLPVCKDLIRCRIKAAGRRVGVKVTPHQLRHTCATQLLNAGCKVTSIQKLLGHRSLNSTLIYARVHDHTVSADYYAAMNRIEKALNLSVEPEAGEALPVEWLTRARLLELANCLAEPQLAVEARLELVEQMRSVLNGRVLEPVAVQQGRATSSALCLSVALAPQAVNSQARTIEAGG